MVSLHTRPMVALMAVAIAALARPFDMPLRANDLRKSLTDSGAVIVENKRLKVRDGVGAQFWITDSERFFMNWVKSDTHTLIPLTSTRRNIRLLLAIFISDPGEKIVKRPDGTLKRTSEITYDFSVLKPDGTEVSVGKDILGWLGRSPPHHMVQLLWGRLSICFEAIDPPSDYIMKVVVHDNVKHLDIPLQRKITLRE